MTFPTLNSSDTADMQSLMSFVNYASGGIFWPVILLVIFLIWVIGAVLIGKPVHRSFLYSSFFCSIIAVLFVLMNWLSTSYMYFLFFLTAVSLIWVRLSESYS